MPTEELSSRPSSPGVNQLMVACQQANENEVRRILSKKPELINQNDRTGKCALHYCSENISTACASVLLEADAQLLQCHDEEGYSTLHLSVISGNKKMVKFLLLHGADPNCKDSEHHSCIHWATVCGEIDCLEMLLNGGADPSTPDIHGAYPIHYAAQMCGPNSEMGNDVRVGLFVLRKLLESGVDVNCRDQDGRQPLLWAASTETRASKTYCTSGSGDAILALVNAGASVCSVDKDGLTALHCAASRGHVECLDTLITLCGAEVDFMDNNGCTALFYSVTLGHADCTTLLLKYGANPNRQDRKGRTPAHCGAAKGQLETIKILSQYGANIWMRNIRGDLPLHEAVQSGRRDLVRWLLEQLPVAVNAGNSNGRTALHIAAVNNNIEMCKILMDLSANVNPLMRNSKSQLMSPLDAALQRGNQGCAKYLQLHGALPATKLLEKHGVNRAFLASIETRNRVPVPEMKIRSPSDHELTQYLPRNTRTESSAQTDIHRYSGTDRESQANQSDFIHQKHVSVEVHRSLDSGEITEARIERTTYRNQSPLEGNDDHQKTEMTTEGEPESLRDRETSAELGFALDDKDSELFSLQNIGEEARIMAIKDETRRLQKRNGSNKFGRNGAKHKVEFESIKGDGNESDGDMPNDSMTEVEGSYAAPLRARRAKSENALRKRINRDSRQMGRENKQRSSSEPRSKVNYVRVVNGKLEPYYLKDDRVLTIEINENQMPPIIPNVAKKRSHNQNQLMKLKSNQFGTGTTSGAENSVISPNSSVKSTESNATTVKDSGFSDYIEMIQSNRCEISSEGSTETLAPQNTDRFWTSDSAADIVDFSRRRRVKRRPFKVDDLRETRNYGDEKGSDIVTEYKNAGPRVAERLQKDKIGSVNLNQVKSKIDTGFYGRRATTIPSRERARVVKVIRPASESQKYANPETIAQEVQQSLRKFELERKLFQELQDLKRQQIRSGRANEAFMVKRLVDKFRKEIFCPGIKDFEPPYSYRNFERYLYDVLRQLSSSNHGKVPKLKPVQEVSLKSALIQENDLTSPSQCVIRTYKCTHASEAYSGYPAASAESVFHNKNYTKLPAINNAHKLENVVSNSQEDGALPSKPTEGSGSAALSKATPNHRYSMSKLHEKRTISSLQKTTKNENKREKLPLKRPPQPLKMTSKGVNAQKSKSMKSNIMTNPPNGWISSTKVSPKFGKPNQKLTNNANANATPSDDDKKEKKVKITRDRRDSLDEYSKEMILKDTTVVLDEVLSKVVNDVGAGNPSDQVVNNNDNPYYNSDSGSLPIEGNNAVESKHPVLSSLTTMFTSPIRFIKGFENKTQNSKDNKLTEKSDARLDLKTQNSSKNDATVSNSSSNREGSAVPSVVLEAVCENLNSDAKPDDLVTVQVSTEGDEYSKLSQTLTVQELIKATQSKILREKEWEYPEKGCPKVKSATEPFTFEIKHGKEKNIYKLPSDKFQESKKYQITFVIGRQNGNSSGGTLKTENTKVI